MKSKVIIIGWAIVLSGCMGSARPDWIPKDTNAFLKEEAFYGVGSAPGVRSEILAKMTAEGQARSEVQHLLDNYAVALMQAYKASLSREDLAVMEETQNLAFTFRTHVVTALFDTEIERYWPDPGNGTLYALAKLKLKRFTSRIRDAEEVTPALRRFVQERAKTVFDQFLAEHEKHQGSSG